MDSIFLGFTIINMPALDNKFSSKLRWTIILCICIISIYGLLLTLTPGENPYITFFSLLFDISYSETYFYGENGGRIFGRISSVFRHPMTLGFFLSISFVYLFKIRSSVNKYVWLFVMTLLVLISLLHGVRTTIATEFACLSYILIKKQNFKQIIQVIGFGVTLSFIFSVANNEAWNYIENLIGIHTSNSPSEIAGSNADMRLKQLGGALSILADNPLVGMGYGWNAYYLSIHETHQTLLAFESLVFVVICNFGLCGIVIYTMFGLKLWTNNKKLLDTDKSVFANTMILAYFTYSIITGEYGYMKYLIIFYSAIYSDSIYTIKWRKSKLSPSTFLNSIQQRRMMNGGAKALRNGQV